MKNYASHAGCGLNVTLAVWLLVWLDASTAPLLLTVYPDNPGLFISLQAG
ncbi:MAG: hypothetical protein HQL87_18970 [Magnetococcales bacterium]|nr:hypothetical protein [Magnetococcales bacterium]